MSYISLNNYLQQLDQSLQEQDGYNAGRLLSLGDGHIMSPNLLNHPQPESSVRKIIGPPWEDIVIEHLACVRFYVNHDFLQAYQHHSALVQNFCKVFGQLKDENWALDIMSKVVLDLRLLSYNANEQNSKRSEGKPGETLEKAAECIMGVFRVCASDNRSSPEFSKRWGMLTLVNHLFKIYFKINKLHLCKPLIRAIDSSPFKDQFSIAQMVTYKFHVGKKFMFDSDFKNAEECLSFAFQRCHKEYKKNKRLILIYLIPVKMLLGHMPTHQLLKKYNLLQFEKVLLAVKQGDLLKLNEALEKEEQFFLKKGIFLILEKLKINTYRNLFKKIYLMFKTHQIPIEAFYAILKTMKMEDDFDIQEVHCILANLIYEGKIKGYLSYQHNKLVVSKQNPFPLLSTLSQAAAPTVQ